MVFSPLVPNLWWTGLDLLAARQGLARGFGNNDRNDATLRRGLQREKYLSRVVVYSIHANIFFDRDEPVSTKGVTSRHRCAPGLRRQYLPAIVDQGLKPVGGHVQCRDVHRIFRRRCSPWRAAQ
jgi:hypothetical protein